MFYESINELFRKISNYLTFLLLTECAERHARVDEDLHAVVKYVS